MTAVFNQCDGVLQVSKELVELRTGEAAASARPAEKGDKQMPSPYMQSGESGRLLESC